MAINLASKYSTKVAERFSRQSITDAHVGKDYDFVGVKTVNVYSVETVPLANYTRTGTGRYGTVAELNDTIQELTMTQDKAFTFSIDKGNDVEQMNIKSANRALKREIDEVVTPHIDKYRLAAWAAAAGTKATVTAPTKTTILDLIMDGTAALDDALVPETNRTLFIPTANYKLLKQHPDFIAVDKLGERALAKGVVGEVDGMKVVKVPTSFMPAKAQFMIKYKGCTADPVKLQEFKIHKDPPGINGDLVEGRLLYDAFVLTAKSKGLYVASIA